MLTQHDRKDFLVNRNDLHDTTTKTTRVDSESLGDGDVMFRVDSFAFTANNITYAAFGDRMQYWNFFPAGDGWGCVPVWGFADVIASKHPDVKVGERFYGYYPMSTHLVVTPIKCSPAGFMDGATHRRELSPIYNQYVRTTTDPGYRSDREDLQMVFRPLFMTSFLIDDFLDDNAYFGAKQIILSSASSKTAFGVAYLANRREGIKVVGLTSNGNVDFCNSIGCYDEVVPYDAIDTLDATVPSVYVDMAGSGPVRTAVHSLYDNNLMFSSSVGASHWDDMGSNADLKGPKPTLFFAPAQGQKRAKEWGTDGLQTKSAEAWNNFIEKAQHWVDVEHASGMDAVAKAYHATLDGTVSPNKVPVLSF